VLAPQHALQIDQGLVAHTPNGDGGPLKKFKDEHVKLGLKFRVCAPITLALVGITSQNFSMRRAARQGCSSGHYFWGRPAPKIWEGKKRLKFSAISDNFRLLFANIPGTDPHIENRKTNLINYNPSHVGRKKDGELWSTNKIFRPLGGAAPSNFYTR